MNQENPTENKIIIVLIKSPHYLFKLFDGLVSLFKKKYQTQIKTGLFKTFYKNDVSKMLFIVYK
jgi:hypothetical protein